MSSPTTPLPRVAALTNGEYGIDKDGNINTSAKTREVKDVIIVSDDLDKKAVIRNAIILGSILVVIAVIITILFNIW